MVTKEQMRMGWVSFAENELARNRNDMAGRWGIPLLAGLVFDGQWQRLVEPNLETIRGLGYMDEECRIDIDRLRREISDVAKRMGTVVQGFPLVGEYSFSEKDVERLYQYVVTS